MSDPINPNHYKVNGLECIDVIESLNLPFHLANAMKYIWRAGRKGSAIEDIKKARWYLDRYINAHVPVINEQDFMDRVKTEMTRTALKSASLAADWCAVNITSMNITETVKPEYTYAYNYPNDATRRPVAYFASEQPARWCVEALNKGEKTLDDYKQFSMPAGINMSQSWAVVEV